MLHQLLNNTFSTWSRVAMLACAMCLLVSCARSVAPPNLSALLASDPNAANSLKLALQHDRHSILQEASHYTLGIMSMAVKNKEGESQAGVRFNTRLGTGIHVGGGFVLTNMHVMNPLSVLDRKEQISDQMDRVKYRVYLSRSEHYTASLYALSDIEDMGILLIATPIPTMASGTFSNSSTVAYGTSIYVLGNPHGLFGVPLIGILGRTDETDKKQPNGSKYVVLNADINSGNSGGPLIDYNGNIIGMISQGLEDAGIGFAISSNVIISFLAENGIKAKIA